MDDKRYNFDQEKYSGDYLSDVNQEVKTSHNLEAIEKLFEEWDDDKSNSDSFTLNNQSFEDGTLTHLAESQSSTPTPYSNSSFYEELLHDKKTGTSSDYLNNLPISESTENNEKFVDLANNNELDDFSNNDEHNDLMDQTREIDSVDLAELKAIQEELHRLYDEPNEESLENEGVSQDKGKTLTKATRQGIAFSNGNLTKTFLDCTVLCFVTASMGFAFLMNIISHI